MVAFYEKWKKYNEIELRKKMDLNNLKIKIQPTSPVSPTVTEVQSFI